MRKRRVARSEVIQREPNPGLPQLGQDVADPDGVRQHRRLGHLEHECLSWEFPSGKGGCHFVGKTGVEQVGDGRVYGDMQLASLLAPGLELVERKLDYLAGERSRQARMRGSGDELVRWDEPAVCPAPADERLDAHDLPRPRVGFRLEVDLEATLFDRGGKLSRERQPLAGVGVALAGVKVVSAARRLGLVHRDVCALHQLVGVSGMGGIGRDAHAPGQPQRQPLDVERLAERMQDLLRDAHHAFLSRSGMQEDSELIPAEACHGVGLTQRFDQAGADQPQQRIASVVT